MTHQRSLTPFKTPQFGPAHRKKGVGVKVIGSTILFRIVAEQPPAVTSSLGLRYLSAARSCGCLPDSLDCSCGFFAPRQDRGLKIKMRNLRLRSCFVKFKRILWAIQTLEADTCSGHLRHQCLPLRRISLNQVLQFAHGPVVISLLLKQAADPQPRRNGHFLSA